MPALDSPAVIVARFLKANLYNESYDAFIAEAGLSPDAGVCSKGDLTLETLLEEKKCFDLSVMFEKLGVEECGDNERRWMRPAPELPIEVKTLPTSSNILSTVIEKTDTDCETASSTLLVSTADRRLHLLDVNTRALKNSLYALHDSPILSFAMLKTSYLITCSMSGRLLISDLNGKTIESRRDHSKYVVKVVIHQDDSQLFLATAGWDCKIILYMFAVANERLSVGEPVATISLPTKPESILFVRHPESGQPILLVSRTDSSFLFYYTVGASPRLLGKQNLAPHSNSWVAFTPSALALCPTDPNLLAVGTSTVPHMKLLIVRLLIPPYEHDESETMCSTALEQRTSLLLDSATHETQASQARAAMTISDREAAAIQIHCSTLAPQTAYSTPAVAWRPDGSGVWVNGDDGVVRGIEAVTGKVISTLKGHEAGSKVRCLWAGQIDEGRRDNGGRARREILVSGGFDQKLLIWETADIS